MAASTEKDETQKLSQHSNEKEGLQHSKNDGDVSSISSEDSLPVKKKRGIILQPVLVGAMIAINLGQTSLQNFYLQTACTVDLGHPLHLCNGAVGGQYEADSQTIVSSVNISRSFVGSLISTVVLLFVGPWSDCSGRRKPPLIMPLVGMSVMTAGVLLMVTFHGASTATVLYVVQIPISLGGNFGLLLAAAFSHVGDVCHAKGLDVTRTMGTHRAAIQVAHVVGAVCGPLLYRNLGFYGVFPIVLLLQLSSLAYVVWAVKDVNVNPDNTVSVFNWRLPLNAVQCLLRPREGRRRLIILLMLVVALGDRMMLSAEVLLLYMYSRLKFGWDDILFGSFLAYRNIISFIGTLIILTVLKRRLKLSDEIVGVLSCISYVVATSGLIASRNTIQVFLIPLIGIIAQGSQVVQRPILNKQIQPNEQGKIYSVMGALESATQTVSSPLYSLLYKKTVDTVTDAWLIPGIVLASTQSVAYLVTRRLGITTHNENTTVKKPVQLQPLMKPAEIENVNEKEVLSNIVNEKEDLSKIVNEKEDLSKIVNEKEDLSKIVNEKEALSKIDAVKSVSDSNGKLDGIEK